MRHLNSGRRLGRTTSHRQAMLRNMACSLFAHEQIRTTLAKAKELRRVAEPLITLGKVSSLANRRLAYGRLGDRGVVTKLFDDLGVRFKNRPGGYLRILKCGFRPGDTAPMAIVQLVERTATALAESGEAKKPEKKAAPKKAAKKTAGEAEKATKKPATKKAPRKAQSETAEKE